MKIAGITTCVDYAKLLARSLDRWRDGLDRLVVMTSPADRATIDLCRLHGVTALQTDAFRRDGAAFNKAAAMDEALAMLAPTEWVLFFDADIVPPEDWLLRLEAAMPVVGNLYGACRVYEDGGAVGDGELAGFFQLWHAADPAARDRPLLGSWHNASGYDSEFIERWPPERRHVLPIEMLHLGLPGRNWCGVGKGGEMAALWASRRNRSYKAERLDRGRA